MALLNTNGKLSLLRVHEVSSKYGPASDQIDVEVVIKFVNNNVNAFGFQLRNNTNMAAHQGMLDILRDAFNNNWIVNIDYSIATGKKNGSILRIWLTK
jgi:hypothetical protein